MGLVHGMHFSLTMVSTYSGLITLSLQWEHLILLILSLFSYTQSNPHNHMQEGLVCLPWATEAEPGLLGAWAELVTRT